LQNLDFSLKLGEEDSLGCSIHDERISVDASACRYNVEGFFCAIGLGTRCVTASESVKGELVR
jgi:hypothetical protein